MKWYEANQCTFNSYSDKPADVTGFINYGLKIIALFKAHITGNDFKIVKTKLKKPVRINECTIRTHEMTVYVSKDFIKEAINYFKKNPQILGVTIDETGLKEDDYNGSKL